MKFKKIYNTELDHAIRYTDLAFINNYYYKSILIYLYIYVQSAFTTRVFKPDTLSFLFEKHFRIYIKLNIKH
jgi:hypothetical protein